MLEAYAKIEEIVRQQKKLSKIFDLGCWAGCLSFWLAKQFPEVSIVGYDQAGPMISALNQGVLPSNLSFFEADYTEGRDISDVASLVISCFGNLDLTTNTFVESLTRLSAANGEAVVVSWHEEEGDEVDTILVDELQEHMTMCGWSIVHREILEFRDCEGDHCSLIHFCRDISGA